MGARARRKRMVAVVSVVAAMGGDFRDVAEVFGTSCAAVRGSRSAWLDEEPVRGPIAIGYGAHFGLFTALGDAAR